jgi:hypothetical protein
MPEPTAEDRRVAADLWYLTEHTNPQQGAEAIAQMRAVAREQGWREAHNAVHRMVYDKQTHGLPVDFADIMPLVAQAREQGRREARAETASVLRKLADGLSQAADALRILAPDDAEEPS